MLILLLNSACSESNITVSYSPPPGSKLNVDKNLRDERIKKTEPYGQKGYSMPYSDFLSGNI